MNSCFNFLKINNNINIRYGAWHAKLNKCMGTVVLLNGRGEFLEKYNDTIKKLTKRNFNVFSLDWRGQGLSCRMLANRHKGYVKSFNDYINDLHYFYTKIVKPNAKPPFILIAHSMGGNIALRFLRQYPDFFNKAVLISPMLNLSNSTIKLKILLYLLKLLRKTGFKKAYVFGASNYSLLKPKYENNKLTSDKIKFYDQKLEIIKNRKLALGGPTFGWLTAGFESMDIINSKNYVNNISIPVLMVSAANDQIVSIKNHKKLANVMPHCKHIIIKNARHEILKEKDEAQTFFWKNFDDFIIKNIV